MKKADRGKKIIYGIAAAVFWVLVWQLVSMAVGSHIILPGPVRVLKSLLQLVQTQAFRKTVWTSFWHIAAGFAAAVAAGVLLAAAAYFCLPLKVVISPLMRLIKAVPVASFIILILLWINSRQLPAVIAFLMVVPVIYINVLAGIESTDPQLLEMSQVYGITGLRKLKYIYVPAVMPHFISGISVGLGFCWKSGIAAEVIGLTPNAIGSRLYEAKLYLMTDELFAWTIVIVVISVIFEKLVMTAVRGLTRGR